MAVSRPPATGRSPWIKPMGLLALLIFAPLLLLPTRASGLAVTWIMLILLAGWCFFIALIIGGMTGSNSALTWLEGLVRAWVARFAPDPERLWIQWAREAHRPVMARRCLDRAVSLGGAEAQFQQGLAYLDSARLAGGEVAALDWFRRAAARGHAEAAFRLAAALRTGLGASSPDSAEALVWYRRSAAAGFGPAAAWLAQAYGDGDGVTADEAQAAHWARVAEASKPHPPLSRSVFRHDAAPEDPLARVAGGTLGVMERAADQFLAHRAGRWVLGGAVLLLVLLALVTVGTFFLAGSAGLFHLPLIMLMVPLTMLAWQAWRLRREGPRRGRDRLREAAERGDPEACFQLGLAHRKGGPHLPKDDLGAVLWFRKAAEAGHGGAMAALAEAYLGGHGVMRDPREAARWAEAARRSTS